MAKRQGIGDLIGGDPSPWRVLRSWKEAERGRKNREPIFPGLRMDGCLHAPKCIRSHAIKHLVHCI